MEKETLTPFFDLSIKVRGIFSRHTPSVLFINDLHTPFMRADPKSAKNTIKPSFFEHLGSIQLKAVHLIFVKLTEAGMENKLKRLGSRK